MNNGVDIYLCWKKKDRENWKKLVLIKEYRCKVTLIVENLGSRKLFVENILEFFFVLVE